MRRWGLLVAVGLLVVVGVYLAGNRGGTGAPPAGAATSTSRLVRASSTHAPAAHAATARHVVVTAPAVVPANWTTVAWVHGQPAIWLAQRSGVALMRIDQSLAHLTLHAGSSDGGVTGWTYGDQISRQEIHLVLAAFNGGFRLTYGDVGFVSGGHVAVPLKPGLASLVTYTDGTSAIGAWQNGVPTTRKTVFSVLQNQRLLVDRGVAAPTVTSCVITCWGSTIRGLTDVARSGLGITANGQLIWAGGEQLSPAGIANALISAGA